MKERKPEEVEYIIERVLAKAANAQEEKKQNETKENRLFYEGLLTAYSQVIDVIRNQLLIYDMDLKDFGVDIDNNEKFV